MPPRSPSRPNGSQPPTPPGTAPLPWLGLVACALACTGCEEEVRHVANAKRPETRAPGIVGVAIDQDDMARPAANPQPQAKPQPQPQPAAKPRPILNQRTQDIRNAQTELQKGGARVGSTRIVARDPITLSGNAYVSIIGRASMLNIQHAVDLWQAENGRYPKDYNEFMDVIIKANNIALPRLPYYQEYGYDEKTHSLVILEYPH
jgi:hypothetical protein